MLHMLFLCSIRAPPIVVQNSLEVVFTQKIKKHNLSFENFKFFFCTHIYMQHLENMMTMMMMRHGDIELMLIDYCFISIIGPNRVWVQGLRV
jgi:hypothetical protein